MTSEKSVLLCDHDATVQFNSLPKNLREEITEVEGGGWDGLLQEKKIYMLFVKRRVDLLTSCF